MFEEMLKQIEHTIQTSVINSMKKYISKDSKFSLTLTQKEVMELIGCKDETTFTLSFKPYLKFAEIRYGKSSTKWSIDLVIAWFKNPSNIQLQRSGRIN